MNIYKKLYILRDSLFFRKHIALLMAKKRWCYELNGNLYFSHEKGNSRCVATGYVVSKSFHLAKQTTDKNGRLLVIGAIVDDVKLIIAMLNHNNFWHWPINTKYCQTSIIVNIIIVVGWRGGGFQFKITSKRKKTNS